ncbi:MAG: cobalamin-dependent protein [Deltaproteobacteria bacterium]|nr:cobalamin-dependent protein [Deltaproteobacteria bacterium]
MKILLIYPYFLEDRRQLEDISVVPQGVFYIAALLKKHSYDVEIINWYNINEAPQNIKSELLKKKPDVIGFSILHANRWGAIDIARIAKQVNPKVKIVFGGIGATFLWEHFLTHFQEVDYVIIGEGEYPFLNLIRCLDKGELPQIEQVKGIAFRQDGQVIRNQDAEPICELDQLPNPAQYFGYQHVSLTRGCAANCHFCGSPQFWGRQVRFHSSNYFVEQLFLLYKQGIKFFYVSDDTFTINARRVIEICKKMIQMKLDVQWAAISRVDMINADILYWMRKAGCIQISYGIESGAEKIRKLLGKHISDLQIRRAFELTQKQGIMARAYFIYGCPQESWHTIEETIELMDAIKPLSAIFYILDLFPGTALYDDYTQRNNLNDDIWLKRIEDIMYFETDPSLSRDLILAFGQKLRSHFYEKLPEFVEALDLIDEKKLYPQHSDFFSRLALTFEKGDYAGIDAIARKDQIAEKLYRRSLAYGHNARAYLGLGMLYQQRRAFDESIQILSTGIAAFPKDEQLRLCLAISYMNVGNYHKALSFLLELQHLKEGIYFIAKCYQALNDEPKAELYLKKYKTW